MKEASPDDQPPILVVDDEPKNLLAVEGVLSGLGGRVVTARSGREALRHLLNQDFAVVLLDVQMPEMDGFQAAQIIRERDRCRHLPIIFITAISKASEHVLQGYALGAVDYVFKPFEPEILRSKVNVFLELFRNRESVKRQAEELQALEERRRAAEVLHAVRRQNDLILNAVGEGVCGFDAGGQIAFVNPAAARITGYRREELLGQSGHALLHHSKANGEHCSGEGCDLFSLMRGRAALRLDDEILWRKDGSSIPIACVGTLLTEGDVASVMVFNDITERQQIERERGRLVRELEEAISARDDFLSIASHELRTPLTPIRLSVQSLRRKGRQPDAALPKGLVNQLETMDRQVSRLDTLINELLDVSRITVGRLDLVLEEFDLLGLVREVLGRFQQELDSGGFHVTLSLGAEGAPPPDVAAGDFAGRWDRVRLDQVVSNLLSNAIKYGGQDKRIEIRVEQTAEGLSVSIRDYGMGISPADQDRIFERFERLISVRHFGGFGLGLWIVRQIADAHGGRVRVASQPGEGSTFTLEVPRTTVLSGRRLSEVSSGGEAALPLRSSSSAATR
jgi:PAS domain S-box-containing protein